MKNEKNNKNKKTVIVGIILLILALLLIVIAVTVGSSKEEHVNSESIVDSTIDNTEDNVSDIVEPGVSDNDIPVAPENGEDDEVGNNGNINKDDADKFTDGDEHDKNGEEKDELKDNNDDESEKTDDSKDKDENDNEGSDKGENNKPSVTPTPSEKDEEDNDGNDKEEDVTPSPTPSEKPVEPTQKPTPSPTPSEKPEKPEKEEDKPSDSKDKVVWNGKEYDKNDSGYGTGGSMTLDTIGTKLPLLPEFNDFALSDTGIGWTGDTGEEEDLLGTVFDDIRADMIDKGIAGEKSQLYGYSNYSIGFSWTFSGGQDDFELSRDPESGIYTLTICRDLKSDYTTLKNADISGYNRDIVKSLLSVMSSTPNQIFDYVYKVCYEDSSIASKNFKNVSGIDCQVRIDIDNCSVTEDGKINKVVFQFR